MAHFYTADPHFKHKSIMKYCERPFDLVEDMDAEIIKNAQEVVKKDDDFWIVGDFAFSRGKNNLIQNIFDKIPGRKHLIIGNHDPKPIQKLGWASVHDMKAVKDGEQEFFLCHYPMITWPKSRYGVLHLFGHVHNNWLGSNKAINVGVDHWDFKPIQKQDILKRMKHLGTHPGWTEAEPE